MEALLSMSFDNLSSYDQLKIRKGLRQVEGLLAQICLSSSFPPPASEKRRSVIDPGKEPQPRKTLSELGADPAFREFFKLQDGFEWNVAMRLVNSLDRLLGKSHDGQNDLLIIQTLDLIQGTLLLHPPSRSLFSRELYMNHLLDLLEPINCPAIQSATIITLACALIETPLNTRTFEELDGLLTITSLFKSRETTREVKLKLVEFLYFYLMPETPSIPSANSTVSVPAMLQRSPSKLAGAFNGEAKGRGRADSESGVTRSTEEKQGLLGRYLGSVDDLVADLRESTPFGGALS
ncbi:cell division control protein 14 [Drepanopeziza brunnea f. sp. 'multigermtubi' MB_m1]|uniref:Cell division control protein 14 n=1 Tax=Marssonina brunnea f. sp. multigermtubi (strain MB_m1) TaxID=1072389 RepID=K1WVS6_MARBU|nr:cell division control protein 14 [Drepanopeziza brunnea f. sp. 'multigermtubi' MB_m1]EKD17111.1 cell division control protein 14 [Drepanopeziza brunnea f. sp. 'multigermtubi' MB_m1]